MYRVYIMKSKFAVFKDDLPTLEKAEKIAKLYIKQYPKSNILIVKDMFGSISIIKEIS